MDDEDERWLYLWNKWFVVVGLNQLIFEDKFEEIIEFLERFVQLEVILIVDDLGQFVFGGILLNIFLLDINLVILGVLVLENVFMLSILIVRFGYYFQIGGRQKILILLIWYDCFGGVFIFLISVV